MCIRDSVNATTITSEGWMLLCDEGSEERMRLDMLAQISVDRIVPAYDVIRRKAVSYTHLDVYKRQ